MTEMLEHVILPYLVQKRKVSMNRKSVEFTVPPSRNPLSQTNNTTVDDQLQPSPYSSELSISSSSASSSRSNATLEKSDLSGIPPPILVYLDGDYSQTMALVNGVRSIFEDDLVSVLKCPGGTSGIRQPNDVMKSHMILRQSTTTGQYWEIFEKGVYDLPDYWEECFLPYFRQKLGRMFLTIFPAERCVGRFPKHIRLFFIHTQWANIKILYSQYYKER